MKLQDILAEYKRQNNVTNLYIAQQTGVTPSTVSRWCRGHIKHIAPSTMDKLTELLGVNVADMTRAVEFAFEKPLLGTVKAGYGLLAEENLQGYLAVTPEDYKRGDYFLQVSGNSMINARIHDGDLLYVRQASDVPSGTIAVLLIGGEEVTVKKLIKKDDFWILQAANPDVDPKVYTLEEVAKLPVQIIGEAVYVRRDL